MMLLTFSGHEIRGSSGDGVHTLLINGKIGFKKSTRKTHTKQHYYKKIKTVAKNAGQPPVRQKKTADNDKQWFSMIGE